MNHPLVSICIPTYNSEKYLRQCLDSIVLQTYKNIEVVIADDGSTDSTVSIIREYVERYGFRFHFNESNKGAAQTSSILVKMAQGRYVAVYHSDDVYSNTIVTDSVAVLDSDMNIGMVCTMADIINEDGSLLGEFRLHDKLNSLEKSSFSFDEIMFGVLLNGGHNISIVTPSVMVRMDCYQTLGFYNEKYKDIYDYEMWLRIALRYRVAILVDKLMQYRMHENQISQRQTNKTTEIPNIVWVISDYRQYITSNELRNYCDDILDSWFMKTAKKQNCQRLYLKSNETLQFVESKKNYMLKVLLQVLNKMHLSVKRGIIK